MLTTPIAQPDSGEREFTHVTATVSAAGDTVVHAPSAGKRVRLRWIYAIPSPESSPAPLIGIRLGGQELFRVFGVSKRQVKTGPADGALVVSLSTPGTVAVTAILEEV